MNIQNLGQIRFSLRKIVQTGLEIGQSATKVKRTSIYPTPSGLNIKVPQQPFLNEQNAAIIRYRKDVACDTILNPIPDGYTKDMGIGFGLESKKDINLTIAKNAVEAGFGNRFVDLKFKIGELITPPHLYKKCPQLKPHYYIDELWSKGKNTGTDAVKDVVLQSLNDPETQGRVLLHASSIDGKTSPVGFYYKLGFRSTYPKTNEACAKWLAEGGKIKNAPVGSETMYLPKENIQHGLDIKV